MSLRSILLDEIYPTVRFRGLAMPLMRLTNAFWLAFILCAAKKKSPAKRRGNAHQALSEAWVGGENAPDIYIIVNARRFL